MCRLITLWVLTGVLVQCGSQESISNSSFYSADAHEVEISFRDHFFVPIEALTGNYQELNDLSDANKADQEILLKALKLQALHLYGVFTYHEQPADFTSHSGAILEEAVPTLTRMKLIKAQGLVRLDYKYRDLAVFSHKLLEGESSWNLSFYMPNQPTTIYAETLPSDPMVDPVTKEPINPCTALHDNSEPAFWYYWSPDREDCPEEIYDKIHLVEARFTRLPSTKRTYPLYRELHKDQLQITLIMGQDEHFGRASDLGFQTFQYTKNYYQDLKLPNGKAVFSHQNITPHHSRFTYVTDQFSSVFDIHYIDTETSDFDNLARTALRHSNVMIFSGHSYEGYYFSLSRLFGESKRSLPKDLYQVMFFNSCTTTSYYGKNYFAAKKTSDDPKGTKRLDIISNAIGASFDDLDQNRNRPKLTADMIVVNSLLGLNQNGRPLKKLLSWQEILNRITRNTGTNNSALTSVNGDEDNPKRLAVDLTVPKPLD